MHPEKEETCSLYSIAECQLTAQAAALVCVRLFSL